MLTRGGMVAGIWVCVWGLCGGTADAQVSLGFKAPENREFTTESNVRFEQKLTIAGMPTETTSDTTSVVHSKAGARNGDGQVAVVETQQALKVVIGGTAGDYVFDSANPDQAGTSALEIFRPVHKALATRKVTKVFNDRRRIEKVIAENILGGLPVELQQLLQNQLDPERVKEATNEELDQITNDLVKPGDSWKRSQDVDLSGGQIMTFDAEYRYVGPEMRNGKQLHKVTSKVVAVRFALDPNSPLPLKVKGSDLKVSESSGTMWIDAELGQVVESTSSTRMQGSIQFAINDMELPSQLDLVMTVNTAVR